MTSGGDFLQLSSAGSSDVINNSGTWNVSGVGTASVLDGVTFNNTGSVNILSGTMTIAGDAGGGTSTGSFIMSNGATLNFAAGTYNLSGSGSVSGSGTVISSAGTVNFSSGTYNVGGVTQLSGGTIDFDAPATAKALNLFAGAVAGSDLLIVSGSLNWTGGAMMGSGTTTLTGTSSTIGGLGNKTLARVLQNNGTTTFSSPDGEGALALATGGTTPGIIYNAGTFNVISGGDFVQFSSAGSADVINNSGTWNVSGVGTTHSLNGVTFNNTGGVNVLGGTMAVSGGGVTNMGSFTVGSGANLFFGADYLLDGGTTITGSGLTAFSNVTLTVGNEASDVISAANFRVSEGVLTGNGRMEVTNLTWTGGAMTGSGTTTLTGTGSVIGGLGNKALGRVLQNNGTTTFSSPDGEGAMQLATGGITPGVINNAGTFNVTSGGDFLQLSSAGSSDVINNSGTWNVSGVGTASVLDGVTFNNTGSVNVLSGTMRSTDTYIQTAGTTRVFAGATLATSNPLSLLGGKLEGAGTVAGSVNNGAGIIAPGQSAGTLAITGSLTMQSNAKLQIEIGGSNAPAFDLVSVTLASLLNGNLEVSFLNGFVPAPTDAFTILTSGTVSGVFANAPLDNSRFATADGKGSFVIDYTPNSVVLTGFVPEPGSTSLLLAGATLLIGRRRRYSR